MLTAKDIHIGDLFKMTSKYPDDRFNNRYILVKSITKRHYDTVWIEALIINEDINIDNIVNIRSNYVKLLYYKKSILEGAY